MVVSLEELNYFFCECSNGLSKYLYVINLDPVVFGRSNTEAVYELIQIENCLWYCRIYVSTSPFNVTSCVLVFVPSIW